MASLYRTITDDDTNAELNVQKEFDEIFFDCLQELNSTFSRHFEKTEKIAEESNKIRKETSNHFAGIRDDYHRLTDNYTKNSKIKQVQELQKDLYDAVNSISNLIKDCFAEGIFIDVSKFGGFDFTIFNFDILKDNVYSYINFLKYNQDKAAILKKRQEIFVKIPDIFQKKLELDLNYLFPTDLNALRNDDPDFFNLCYFFDDKNLSNENIGKLKEKPTVIEWCLRNPKNIHKVILKSNKFKSRFSSIYNEYLANSISYFRQMYMYLNSQIPAAIAEKQQHEEQTKVNILRDIILNPQNYDDETIKSHVKSLRMPK